MDNVTPERLQQALFDGLQGLAGQPFDPERTKKAIVDAAMTAIPPDPTPSTILHADDGDWRAELVTGENGLPALRLVPIVYTVTITVDPNEVSRP